jgi:hypothetical protein
LKGGPLDEPTTGLDPRSRIDMVDAVRGLTLGPASHALYGHPGSYYITGSLLWTGGIIAVTAPLAVARYRRG